MKTEPLRKEAISEENARAYRPHVVRICPVSCCLHRVRTRDGLRAHLYGKHSKKALVETIQRWLGETPPEGLKATLVEKILDLLYV